MRPENREAVMFMLLFGALTVVAGLAWIRNALSKPEDKPSILERFVLWLDKKFPPKADHDEHETNSVG